MVLLELKFGFVTDLQRLRNNVRTKKIKYRKVHRGNRKGMAKGGTEVNFGSYGMKAMEPGWITARQIEATRISISRRVRKVGKMWIRIFPDKPITKKPLKQEWVKVKVLLNIG